MPQPELKPNKIHILILVCMLVIWVLCAPILLVLLVVYPNSLILKIFFPIACLLIGTLLLIISNLGAFRYDYSIVGRYKRKPLPNESPIMKQCGSFGWFGHLFITMPFVTWIIYPSGLGIIMFGVGKVFISTENIKELKEDKSFPYPIWPPYRLFHNSEELYNPVVIPSKKLFEAIKLLLQ